MHAEDRCCYDCELSSTSVKTGVNHSGLRLEEDAIHVDSEGIWHCPHPTLDERDRCVFHTHPSERPPETDAQAAFQDIIVKPEETDVDSSGSNSFVGATFERLVVDGTSLGPRDRMSIDLRHASVDTLLVRSRSTSLVVRLDGAHVTNADFSDVTLDRMTAEAARIETASFEQARIGRGEFKNLALDYGEFSATHLESAEFMKAEFGKISFPDSTLDSGDFSEASGDEATFVNATLGVVDFNHASFGRISLEHATLNSVDFGDVVIDQHAQFRQSNIKNAYFDRARLTDANFQGAMLSDVEFDETHFDGATFQKAVFGPSEADFTEAHLQDVEFDLTRFDRVRFVAAQLQNVVITRSELGTTRFAGASLRRVVVENSTVDAIEFGVNERRPQRAGESLDVDEPPIVYDLEILDSEVGQAVFEKLQFAGTLVFRGSEFDDCIIQPAATGTRTGYIDFRDGEVRNGTFHQPDNEGRVVYDLERATIGDLTFEGGNMVPKLIKLVDTTFDGFDFSSNGALDLSGCGYEIHTLVGGATQEIACARAFSCLLTDLVTGESDTVEREASSDNWNARAAGSHDDTRQVSNLTSNRRSWLDGDTNPPDYVVQPREQDRFVDDEGASLAVQAMTATDCISETADLDSIRLADDERDVTFDNSVLETTYLKAKNGADDIGDATAAGEFFYLQLSYRRRQARAVMLGRARPNTGTRTRVSKLTQWIRNVFMWGTTGYGERPRRVVFASMAITVGFGIVYQQLSMFPFSEPTSPTTIDFLLFSGQSFVSFLAGVAPISASWTVRLVSVIEGFIGAFFVALFVFTLTRRIHR